MRKENSFLNTSLAIYYIYKKWDEYLKNMSDQSIRKKPKVPGNKIKCSMNHC